MDSSIASLVGSLGFPIVMCLVLVFWFKKTLDVNTDAIKKLASLVEKLCEDKKK